MRLASKNDIAKMEKKLKDLALNINNYNDNLDYLGEQCKAKEKELEVLNAEIAKSAQFIDDQALSVIELNVRRTDIGRKEMIVDAKLKAASELKRKLVEQQETREIEYAEITSRTNELDAKERALKILATDLDSKKRNIEGDTEELEEKKKDTISSADKLSKRVSDQCKREKEFDDKVSAHGKETSKVRVLLNEVTKKRNSNSEKEKKLETIEADLNKRIETFGEHLDLLRIEKDELAADKKIFVAEVEAREEENKNNKEEIAYEWLRINKDKSDLNKRANALKLKG